jgi:DNA processing protein
MLTDIKYSILKLIRSENVGSTTYHKLIEQYGNASAVIKNIDVINNKLKRKIVLAKDKALNEEIKLLEKLNGQFLFDIDDEYPAQLKFINDNPPVLCCIGDVSLLSRKQIAIVGARSVSSLGQKLTRKMAGTLAKKGYVVTSGLARGVDGLAHLGCLDEHGKTVAVLGSSVDFIYPSENKDIYENIIANGGLIISENKTGSGIVSKHQFPKRNRIIAALSVAVVVTECTKKSGSLITAKLALEMGKDLFAVPGHPLDNHFDGTNDLIKQSCAYVLTNVDDLLEQVGSPEDLSLFTIKNDKNNLKNYVFEEKNIELEELDSQTDNLLKTDLDVIDVIIIQPLTIDEIIRITGLDEQEVANQITMLELEGKLKRLDGGQVTLL